MPGAVQKQAPRSRVSWGSVVVITQALSLRRELEALTPLGTAAQPTPIAEIPQPARVAEPEESAFEITSVSGRS